MQEAEASDIMAAQAVEAASRAASERAVLEGVIAELEAAKKCSEAAIHDGVSQFREELEAMRANLEVAEAKLKESLAAEAESAIKVCKALVCREGN